MLLTRRAFLATSALSFAAPLRRKPVVAAHPWVYAATQPKYDIFPILDTIFEDMKAAGIEAIELMHTALRPSNAVERIGELSARTRLPVLGTSFEGKMFDRTQHAAVMDDIELVVPRLAKLGGRTLGVSVGDAGRKKTEAELDAQAEVLRKVMAVCEKNGVVPNLHNHIYEVKDGEYDLRGTLSRIPEAKLGPDLDWLRGAGVDPVEFIRRNGSRIVYAHLRDRKVDGVWSEALGEGSTDFAGIAQAFKDVKFQGDVAIELAHPAGFRPTRPLRESLRMSRDLVRSIFGW